MKRLVCRLALLLVLALSTVSMAQVTISVSHPHGPPSSDALQMVVDRFNELYSDIQVVLEYVPGGTTQDELAVRVAAGAAPDVIVLADLVLAEWAGSGALVQLDPYMERDGFSMDQFWPSSTAAVTWLGKTWALPHTQDARALFVNKDDFAEAGLDDRGPRVLADLEAYHRTLTRRTADGTFEHVGIVPRTIQGWFTRGLALWRRVYRSDRDEGDAGSPEGSRGNGVVAGVQLALSSGSNRWFGQHVERHVKMMVHGVGPGGKQNLGHVNWAFCPCRRLKGQGLDLVRHLTMAITRPRSTKRGLEFLKLASVEGQQMQWKRQRTLPPIARRFAPRRAVGCSATTFAPSRPDAGPQPPDDAGRRSVLNELHRAMSSVINQQATPQAALEEARRATQQALDEFVAAMEQ